MTLPAEVASSTGAAVPTIIKFFRNHSREGTVR